MFSKRNRIGKYESLEIGSLYGCLFKDMTFGARNIQIAAPIVSKVK